MKALLSVTFVATVLGTFAAAAAPQLTTITSAANGAASGTQPPANAEMLRPGWLTDSKTECALRVPDGVSADAASWPGSCVDGSIAGDGTLSLSKQGRFVEALDGTFAAGVLKDGHAVLKWADGSSYDGAVADGSMNGPGLLTTAAGDRFQGAFKAGRLDGHGTAQWANGDRYDGDWHNGKSEGHGVQVWADGRRYDGQWRDDQPNGRGIITRADGSRYQGDFVDGQSDDLVLLASADAGDAKVSDAVGAAGDAAAKPDKTAQPTPITGIAGKKLLAVDGSVLTLTLEDNGFARELVAPNGETKSNSFSFLGPRLGSISDDDGTVDGVFRITDKGIVAEYGDGRAEYLFPNDDGGVSISMRAPTGDLYCMAWYPQGHQFSLDERKAALAAYAASLGLADPRAKASRDAGKPGCAAPPGDAQAVAPMPAASVPVPLPAPSRHKAAAALSRHVQNAAPKVVAASFTRPAPQTHVVDVRPSTVHLIDADPAQPDVPQPALPQTATAALPANAAHGGSASACLSVESDGQHWGFRNHCGFDVQFAYCLMNASEPLAACDKGGISGSVAPNGTSALVVDRSLSETSADHDFRWVACGGGAGEVVVHLDRADPPAGRCVRTGAS